MLWSKTGENGRQNGLVKDGYYNLSRLRWVYTDSANDGWVTPPDPRSI